jgi:hypothetical protein
LTCEKKIRFLPIKRKRDFNAIVEFNQKKWPEMKLSVSNSEELIIKLKSKLGVKQENQIRVEYYDENKREYLILNDLDLITWETLKLRIIGTETFHAELLPDLVDVKEEREFYSVDDLFSQTLEECKRQSHTGLSNAICALFHKLVERGEEGIIYLLKEKLQDLGLDPNSENYEWRSEPDKGDLIEALTQFQYSLRETNQIPTDGI